MNKNFLCRKASFVRASAIALAGVVGASLCNAAAAVPTEISDGLADVSLTFTTVTTAVIGFVVVGLGIRFLRRAK